MASENVQRITPKETLIGAPPSRELRDEVARGLLYAHSKLNKSDKRTLEAMSFLYALIELLEEKGLVVIDELDQRKGIVADRLVRRFRDNGIGALFQDPEYDKYNFEQGVDIDCDARLHLCKAACCRLPFALSRQDVREGTVRWDLGQPYLIEQDEDSYCSHLDRCAGVCTIYKQRPVPCRGFDCRTDKRIWLDFGDRRINPDIDKADWPRCLADESGQESTQ